MTMATRGVGACRVIDLQGRLDTGNAEATLAAFMDELQDSPGQVLITLTALEFVSSAGLRVILRVAKHVRGYSGALKVCGADGMVKEVLEISGFDSLLDMYETEEKALSAFS